MADFGDGGVSISLVPEHLDDLERLEGLLGSAEHEVQRDLPADRLLHHASSLPMFKPWGRIRRR